MNKRVIPFVMLVAVMVAGLVISCAQPTPQTVEKVVQETVVVEKVVKETVVVEKETPKLLMSFVPSGDTQEIITGGEAIESQLEEITGYEVDTNVATSFAAVVEAMGAGNADIGWLNTFGYILAHEKYDVDVILATVRFGRSFYTGQIIARADSGIETLSDLAGKTMCWVDPLSTSGYVIPRVMLQAEGIDPDADFADTIEAGSHNNVVAAVYNGDCDAGATYVDARGTIEDDFPDVKDKVVVITESPEIPNDTVSVRKGLDPEIVENIQNALLEIAQTEGGQAALEEVYEIEGLVVKDDSFYDAFRTTLDAAGVDIEELASE
ncbi:MAG: putative ABC transporter phosphonate/phosphite binding protein PhnD2 [Anaerolineales bacterium]|nr:putative ABC transporter phosphonate/phosphite binding protein PhnD2 [Anaerolineales bacterium]